MASLLDNAHVDPRNCPTRAMATNAHSPSQRSRSPPQHPPHCTRLSKCQQMSIHQMMSSMAAALSARHALLRRCSPLVPSLRPQQLLHRPVASMSPVLLAPRALLSLRRPYTAAAATATAQQTAPAAPPPASGAVKKKKAAANLPPPDLPPSQWTLNITESAAKRINELKEKEQAPNLVLRVAVDSGGCSGFQYKVDVAYEHAPEDRVFERDGARVVVDEPSLSRTYGSTVDYETTLMKRSFVIVDNPHAQAGCGCGVSFDLKI